MVQDTFLLQFVLGHPLFQCRSPGLIEHAVTFCIVIIAWLQCVSGKKRPRTTQVQELDTRATRVNKRTWTWVVMWMSSRDASVLWLFSSTGFSWMTMHVPIVAKLPMNLKKIAGLTTFLWLARSPDLNPIENVLLMMKGNVRRKLQAGNTLEQLRFLLERESGVI